MCVGTKKNKPLSSQSAGISGLICHLSINHPTLTVTGFLYFCCSWKRKGYLDLSPKTFYSEKLYAKYHDLKPSGTEVRELMKTPRKRMQISGIKINVFLANLYHLMLESQWHLAILQGSHPPNSNCDKTFLY